MPTGTIDIVRANFSRRKDIQGELRSIDEAATADQRGYTETEEARQGELRSELEAIDGRIEANIEQSLRSAAIEDGIGSLLGAYADRESGDIVDTRSLGERFVDVDEFRSWVDSGARGTSPTLDTSMDFRAVTDTTTAATSGGALIQNQRLSRVANDFLDRRTFLIDLLPSIQVSTGGVEVVRDASPLADMANKAVEVAEAAAKPQAGVTMAVDNEPIQTIAAWANITRQAAADSPQVAGYLDGRLRYSVKRRADGQVINGNGTSPNISGLLDRSGINAYTAPSGSEPAYASIRKAITLMEQDEAVPEIVVLNPADAENFDLSNAASAGLHAVPNLAGPSATTSWGLTQVRSTAVASGTAVLIDPMAVAVLDRQQVTAYMTDSHASLFVSNILTLLLEARLGLAVFEPAGICSVTFDYVA
ncbi:phage major capsid protein [Iamia majanohamensis]|uniref:Phage major capsid protein n=1 Tax=Iamia majanohamensis TaxID=467976 RepID=A0AAE9Y6L4_9ACTN|nr:phage major capsid protein [Iamia majanohamensis]WCO67880.1 phage major capsid protein [Iamia majanohamensis]